MLGERVLHFNFGTNCEIVLQRGYANLHSHQYRTRMSVLHFFTNNIHYQMFQFFQPDRLKWKFHLNLHFFNYSKLYFHVCVYVSVN